MKNYILTAFRSLLRNSSFSIINIFGLSTSMAVCMLIILILQDQLSYDNFHKNKDRIYRIQSINNLGKISLSKFASATWPLAKELKENYPFVEETVALNSRYNAEGISDEKRFDVAVFFATPSFFTLFDFKLKNNLASNPLSEPSTIVITEEVADKFFGDNEPIGKTINFEKYGTLKVTGVISETKRKSHIQFDALISSSTIPVLEKENKIDNITDNWEEFSSTMSICFLTRMPGKVILTLHWQRSVS